MNVKKNKGIIIGGLVALLVVSIVVGVAVFILPNQVEDEGRMTIAVSIIEQTHTWPDGVYYYAYNEIQLVAEENDWDYELLVASSTNEQSDQIMYLIEQEVDCIILLPMDGASLKTAAMSVQDAGIPLVIFDREIPDFSPTATVKGNNTTIGNKTADIFNGRSPDGGFVIEIMGDTSTVPQQRTDGFNDVIDDNFVVEQIGYTNWNREETQRVLEEWIEKQTTEKLEEVNFIFSHDDEITLGILDVIDEYKESGIDIFPNLSTIVGSAGAKDLYERMMVEEEIELISLTYSPDMIIDAIRVGENIINGDEYEKMTIIEPIEVNAKNVETFYNENAWF